MASRTQRLQFGQDLTVLVKHRSDGTIVHFVFEKQNRLCFLIIKILKDHKTFFMDRLLVEGENRFWDVKGYAIDAGQIFVRMFDDNPERDMTPEQRQEFRIKWQEALNQLINEDTFTFQIPTFLCEVLALENEVFQIDLEFE